MARFRDGGRAKKRRLGPARGAAVGRGALLAVRVQRPNCIRDDARQQTAEVGPEAVHTRFSRRRRPRRHHGAGSRNLYLEKLGNCDRRGRRGPVLHSANGFPRSKPPRPRIARHRTRDASQTGPGDRREADRPALWFPRPPVRCRDLRYRRRTLQPRRSWPPRRMVARCCGSDSCLRPARSAMRAMPAGSAPSPTRRPATPPAMPDRHVAPGQEEVLAVAGQPRVFEPKARMHPGW